MIKTTTPDFVSEPLSTVEFVAGVKDLNNASEGIAWSRRALLQ